MLNNYLTSIFRNLLKTKIFTFVNVVGLAIGIASTLLLTEYVLFERSYESMHDNADNIFRITMNLYNDGVFIENDCETYQTLGPDLTDKMPEVLGYARMMNWDAAEIKANGKANFEKKIYMADPSAFDLFSYQMIDGNPKLSFDQPFQVVLTESTAMKYFGKTDVVGSTMSIQHTDDPLTIVGVMRDLPKNTHLKFDILISHATIEKYLTWYPKYPWGGNNEYTYLLMQEGVSVDEFNKKLAKYSSDIEALEDEIVISERIGDIHLYSNKTFEPEVNGSAQSVNFMAMIAIFIMVIAWVNYINLSTARATERAKEVGIRKVVGSSKSQLVRQFLFESFLVNIVAALVAFTLVQLAFPLFLKLTEQQLPVNLLYNTRILLMLAGIVTVGTVLAGVYPAFVLSSFRPAQVLKGKFHNSRFGLSLRKGLIIFQFATTVILMSVSVAVYQQINYLTNKDLSIDIDNTVIIRTPNSELSDSAFYYAGYKVFKNKLEESTQVELVAQGSALPGADNHEVGTIDNVLRQGADKNEGSYNYYVISVNEDYYQSLGLPIVAGSNFAEKGNNKKVIINERAVETLGFGSASEAVGEWITSSSEESHEVIGVVSNYHQRSPKEDFVPMIFSHSSLEDYIVVKLNTRKTKKAMLTIQNTWDEVFTGSGMDYYFLDQRYHQQYKSEELFSTVTLIFTILSISIACMGLFGLSSYLLLQRTKEVGIRKVLGATIPSLIKSLSFDFIKLVAVAGLLGMPVAYYLVVLWLENFSYKLPISWGLMVLPFVIIILIAVVTVLSQVVKSSLANPVNSLKYE